MPSACVGTEKSYYEPSHGSAPDIAGKGTANPYSMIGSVALMLEKSFEMDDAARRVWDALRAVFAAGHVTADLAAPEERGKALGTAAFGDLVVAALKS
jgi:3-isopropylmalate dehydrogenase